MYTSNVTFTVNTMHDTRTTLNDGFETLCHADSSTEILKIAHLKQTDCLGTDWSCTRQWNLQHVLLMHYIMHAYFQRNFYRQYDALMPESFLYDEFRFLGDLDFCAKQFRTQKY